jgi:hypothetical protein
MIKHVVRVGVMINVNIDFVTKVEVKHSRGRARCKPNDNITINLTNYYVPLCCIATSFLHQAR